MLLLSGGFGIIFFMLIIVGVFGFGFVLSGFSNLFVFGKSVGFGFII